MLIILVLVAIAPPIAFLIFILRHDQTEPEPIRMVLKIMLLGALSIIPAAIIQLAVLDQPFFQGGGILGAALESFLVVAASEELVKLAVVLIFAWSNRNFNEKFDGIVYTGAAAIGFALAENIFYVLDLGLTVGILRAVTAIPGHTFTGVLMGYYVGKAKYSDTTSARNGNLIKGFLIAYSLHALYNTLVLSDTAAALLMVPLVIFYFVIGTRILKEGSAASARRWAEGVYQPVPEAGLNPPPVTQVAQEADLNLTEDRSWLFLRAVVARIIFIATAVLWVLLFIGLADEAGTTQETLEIISGGLLLTVVPLVVAIMLERSYQRKRLAS
ncbi:MAG: PrsW family intramembrane metalloprotease [Firmicutes bacterium]|nr:PrsW family intramembrane metalloprotease [Bacillota bacterium]